MISPAYPLSRLRRNRRFDWLRDLVAENHVSTKDLIWPLFIREKEMDPQVATMPGVRRYTVEELPLAVERARTCGITTLMLFPVVARGLRDANASQSLHPENLVLRALEALRALAPEIGLMADLALDPYTDHGHDGFLDKGEVHNDSTIERLAEVALLQARAGAHIIAPSDMMDGRVGAIRRVLDAHNFENVGILSYAAKYSSALYGPFRDILDSNACLKGSDKNGYQMDPRNAREALREVAQDLEEGADTIMVKPGTLYLDIVRQVKDTFGVPTFAYHVSGEYAMLKAAAAAGCIDERRTVLETLICFKRAGADAVVTYSAPEAALWLKEEF